MSYEVPTWHVEQYKQNVHMLAQQKGSRLRPTVRTDGDIIGKRVAFDRLGATAMKKKTGRHTDTPLMNSPHSRRWGVLYDFEWADLVDNEDKLKVINDPTSPYATAAMWSAGRSMDDEIISAASGTALTGESGSGSQALPSSQKIAHGSAGLTLAKLIEAREILDAADVDPDQKRTCVVTAKQVTNLLNTTEVKSADYNTVKALAQGQVNSFMGFEFVRTQRLTTNASSNRLCLAYTASAIGLMIPKEPTVDIGPRRDKSKATQVYVCMGVGAVRIEDEQLVEIECTES